MRIEDILERDIDRHVDGVVKASNNAQLQTEIAEYVITADLEKHLTELLEAYTLPGTPESNGVWIAGFFGSGKSHLLKMLAHLLGDITGSGIDREQVLASFLSKIPASNAILRGALERSSHIPATSLLFNIDEKVDKNEKDQPDALLKVFVQVFYNACGFYGNSPHIARFERGLAKLGHLEAFTEAFPKYYGGKSWEQSREHEVYAEAAVAKAIEEVTGTAVAQPLATYRNNYTVSIESFADEVAQWLDLQPDPKAHLNFFIDEVGQFIGSNTKLMLSLQTIAETLFTRCGGRSWIMVTSQEMMDSIIGDRTKAQQQDFSKIQGRFAVQLKLDSQNVHEVVSKRLLAKKPEVGADLARIYHAHADQFRSMFAFPTGQLQYKNYTSEENFAGIYPFVDYQFSLFQKAMIGLSEYNAFTGRHASVGERSLLGVAKQIGSQMKHEEVGSLATFDRFYDGIEKSILSNVKLNIHTAEANLDDPLAPLAVRVLKTLLMVKYVDGFEASAQSLAVLLNPGLDTNIAQLRGDIDGALNLLESNTLAQRTNFTFSYLTNEEQDVEKAIKAVERNDTKIKKFLNERIVEATGIGAKVRHDVTGTDLGIQRILDGERQGRTEELAAHFVTPFLGKNDDEIRALSMGESGHLFIVLDLSQRTLDELDLYVKTENFVRTQPLSSLVESRRRIVESHQRFNEQRRTALQSQIVEAVSSAQLVHNGADITSVGSDPKGRVHTALQTVIESRYNRILEAKACADLTESSITGILEQQDGLDLAVSSSLDTVVDEVMIQVKAAKTRSTNLTVTALAESFAIPPFGWSLTAVLVALARGVKTDRLRLVLDSRTLVRSEIPGELRNSSKRQLIRIEEVRVQDPAKIAALRSFLAAYRHDASAPSNTEGVIRAVRDELVHQFQEATRLKALDYPFIDAVERVRTTLEPMTHTRPDEWYLDGFLTETDQLLEDKDDVLDPIRGFLNGTQKSIYDNARDYRARTESELTEQDRATADTLSRLLESPTFFRGNAIQQIKSLHDELSTKVGAAVEEDRRHILESLTAQRESLLAGTAYSRAIPAAQERAIARLDAVEKQVIGQTSRSGLALVTQQFETEYGNIIEQLLASRPAPTGGKEPDASTPPPPPPALVRIRNIQINGVPDVLTDSNDVEAYLGALRTKLLGLIDDGKQILR